MLQTKTGLITEDAQMSSPGMREAPEEQPPPTRLWWRFGKSQHFSRLKKEPNESIAEALMSFRDRKKFHRGFDVSYALIDIAKVVKPSLNLIDGIYAMEGMSAHVGKPRPVGVLIGSIDMVAADIVGSRIMGFDPMEVATTQIALKDKLSVESLDQIETVGEPIENVRVSLARPFPRVVHPHPDVELIPGGICPGCAGRIPKIPPPCGARKTLLRDLRKESQFSEAPAFRRNLVFRRLRG
jgi:hypothetical protein